MPIAVCACLCRLVCSIAVASMLVLWVWLFVRCIDRLRLRDSISRLLRAALVRSLCCVAESPPVVPPLSCARCCAALPHCSRRLTQCSYCSPQMSLSPAPASSSAAAATPSVTAALPLAPIPLDSSAMPLPVSSTSSLVLSAAAAATPLASTPVRVAEGGKHGPPSLTLASLPRSPEHHEKCAPSSDSELLRAQPSLGRSTATSAVSESDSQSGRLARCLTVSLSALLDS